MKVSVAAYILKLIVMRLTFWPVGISVKEQDVVPPMIVIVPPPVQS